MRFYALKRGNKGEQNGRQGRQERQGQNQKTEESETERRIEKETGEAATQDSLAGICTRCSKWNTNRQYDSQALIDLDRGE